VEPATGHRVASRPHHRDGRSTRWDPHRRQRRETIIKAAIAAIEEYGPEALTGQIADMAGVPRTHVYRHFEGKPALDLAVSRQLAREVGETIRAGLSDTRSARLVVQGGVAAHLKWVQEHPNLYRFLAQNAFVVGTSGSATDDAKAVLATELAGVLHRYMREFGLEETPAADRVVVGVVGLVDNTAIWWIERKDLPREELTAELTEQVWLLIDRLLRSLGLELDPDAPLPAA
jgi:AcrR family transcriptional regulator